MHKIYLIFFNPAASDVFKKYLQTNVGWAQYRYVFYSCNYFKKAQGGTNHIVYVFYFWFKIYQGNKIAKSEANYTDQKKEQTYLKQMASRL